MSGVLGKLASKQALEGMFRDRRARLCARLEELGLRFLLVTKPTNIFYLTGFRGSAGVLMIGPGRARLWVDPRYTLQAREQSRGSEVVETRRPFSCDVGAWIRRARPSAIGFEDAHLTAAALAEFRRDGASSRRVRWRGVGGLLEELREVKDAWEIERIREAGNLTARVFTEVLPLVKPGVRENDLAAELDFRMKRNGGEGPAFETIVASGARSAWPHARASSRQLRGGELVIFDLGAILAGYAADMTRTLYLGVPRRRARRLYESVAEAQQETVQSLCAGLRAGDADAVARQALARRRLEQFFTHSTGHGVGLEVHERPRLARGETTLLQVGAVLTVEPGLYVAGYGGVRIEDTVLLGANGAEILTPAPKEPWCTA
jgi:Xaa-Pro aminopeptidase